MHPWFFSMILLLAFIGYYSWIIYGFTVLNKEVFIKRINPPNLHSLGDLIFKEDEIQIKFKWKIKVFSFTQIWQIKAYNFTDWGLQEYEQIDIKFDNLDKIILDGSLKEHQDFIEFMVLQLGIIDKKWAWGFLPHLGDKTGRDIIFEKNKSN